MSFSVSAFDSRDAAIKAAADRLEHALREGLALRGGACAALSGGSTPEPAYAALAARGLDWPRITFTLVDERWLPPSDPGSNEAMLRRALAPALARGARLLPMWSDAPSPAAGADRAELAYAGLEIDIALMGMGGDAHTASWFPGTPDLSRALDPHSTRNLIAVNAPHAAATPERLTLTLAAIQRARRIALLITGEDKRARLDAALSEPTDEAPVGVLVRECAAKLEVIWAG